MSEWYRDWFNEDYQALYAYRDSHKAQKEVESVIRLLHLAPPLKLLDVGCGVGHHALHFARHGFTVTGVDLSQTLLDQAKEAAKHHHLNVKFVCCDMRQLEPLGTFDCITSFFTSFGYFEKEDANLQVLQSIAACLVDGGQFFLDYLHPAEVERKLPSCEVRTQRGDLVHTQVHIEKGVAIKQIHFPHAHYEERVRLYHRDELKAMLLQANLQVITILNDYEGHPWQSDGNRQLFLCRRTPR